MRHFNGTTSPLATLCDEAVAIPAFALASWRHAPGPPKTAADGCAHGFRWVTDGCYASDVPEHAVESYADGGWDCVVGYAKKDDRCVPQ
jgi:hypothetical protein